ncbi:hypothetical protein COU80_03565 [Candidatus Peregrinibacteria bacterium CG10_big_fil_rev_8_21_14_0_10_55_24]|nr:MAG: hypothetical protein COU80_03565 [Candidatus Peregrinibacteria bacterium CG10_big_fil_rev_8_21_14_0_10_55_24]
MAEDIHANVSSFTNCTHEHTESARKLINLLNNYYNQFFWLKINKNINILFKELDTTNKIYTQLMTNILF